MRTLLVLVALLASPSAFATPDDLFPSWVNTCRSGKVQVYWSDSSRGYYAKVSGKMYRVLSIDAGSNGPEFDMHLRSENGARRAETCVEK